MTSINNITNITIETSTLCNAKCLICPNQTSPRPTHFMSLQMFENIINLFSNLDTIALCGMYEPLIDNRLPQILNIIKKVNLDMKIVIYTNASLLDKWEDLLLENTNLSSIIFSVHGLSSKTYNAIMEGLDRDKTYQNIINFCNKLKNKENSTHSTHKLKTTISFVKTSLNIHELDDFISFWKDIVNNVANYELMNWNGQIINYKNLLDKPKTTLRTCPMFEQPLVIDAFGNVSRCCYNLKFNYENINNNGLTNWFSKKRISEIYPDTDCFRCDGWRYY